MATEIPRSMRTDGPAKSTLRPATLLTSLSQWTAEALGILWTYRIIVLSLLVLYLALWQMDQGQDLLVNLNDSDSGIIAFYVTISVLAAVHWHLAKYLSYQTMISPGEKVDYQSLSYREITRIVFAGQLSYADQKHSNIARMLGVLTILIPAFGVIHVLETYKLTSLPAGWLLLGVSLVFVFVFHANLIERGAAREKIRLSLGTMAAVLVIAIFLFSIVNKGRPAELKYLAIGLLFLAVAFSVVVSMRRKIEWRWIAQIQVAPFVMWPALALVIFFTIININPYVLAMQFNGGMSTILVLLSALVFYVLFFFSLALIGRKTKINWAGIFVLASLLSAVLIQTDFHDVERTGAPYPSISLETYIKGWLESRQQEVRLFNANGKPYPVYLINAYGGGIRAAAFTTFAVSHLDSIVYHERNGRDSFREHVLSISGASGGTMGASVLLSTPDLHGGVVRDYFQFYRRDFLSPVLAGMMGRDFMYTTAGSLVSGFGKFDDRAIVQEKTWAAHIREGLQSVAYEEDFRKIWSQDNYHAPLLLANTYYVEEGMKGIVSPVRLRQEDFPTALIVDTLLNGGSFLLRTAAFLSARFPLISPAGTLSSKHHFMDGGLKENSGAETSRELAKVLERILGSSWWTASGDSVKIYILSLKNMPDQKAPDPIHVTQPAAPVQALYQNWVGNTTVADDRNAAEYKKSFSRISPSDSGPGYTVVFPLGWQISGVALNRLNVSLREGANRVIVEDIRKKCALSR